MGSPLLAWVSVEILWKQPHPLPFRPRNHQHGTLTDGLRGAGERWSRTSTARRARLESDFAEQAPEGITVVGLEQVIAGPFCTRQLASSARA